MSEIDLEDKLRSEKDFLEYLYALKQILSKYVVFIAVEDTGIGPYFTAKHAQALMALGLKTNMMINLENRYQRPYLAIINKGKIVVEQYSDDLKKALVSKGKINSHDMVLYSAGYQCSQGIGSGARAFIDGTDYFTCGRGFKFLVFDVDKDYVVDASTFDSYDLEDIKHIFKPYNYQKELKKISDDFATKGAKLCTFSMPRFPSMFLGEKTEEEVYIWSRGYKVGFEKLRDNPEVREKIWEEQNLHFCKEFDTLQDFEDAINTPDSFINMNGVRQFNDKSSNTVNIRNGIRVTSDQPQESKNSIFVVGKCTAFGVGASDENTIASYLQRELNENEAQRKFMVNNYGYFVGGNDTGIIDFIPIMKNLSVRRGDIVLLQIDTALWGIPYCDLRQKSTRPHPYGELFLDKGHYTKNGNHMTADGLYEFLKKNELFEEVKSKSHTQSMHTNVGDDEASEELVQYKHKLQVFYNENICPKIGSLVMNCNPFTLGHRYLVEQALQRCDHLIVFVVEEDKSVFPFAERIELVRKNLADLKRVSVIPSGQFIISTKTFKEYFNKESLQDCKIDTSLDVRLFAKEIAPCMNITMRFAGEEPTDAVTRQYNESMAKLLPQYGIKFMEIPRIKYKGKPISASEVRHLAKEHQFDKLKKLVPSPTLQYLRRKLLAK